MADVIWITDPLVKVTGNTQQSVDSAIDVGAYDELFIQTYLTAIETPSSPTVTVSLYTSMQNQVVPATLGTTDGWVLLFSNTLTATGVNNVGQIFVNLLSKGTFLRYLLWRASSFSGAASMTFWMAGVARSYGTT